MMFLSSLTTLILIMVAMAFFTLLEQKLLGYIQTRKGPNKTSLMAIPQPASDGMKLFTKESTNLANTNTTSYLAAPPLSILLAMLMWMIFPTPSPHFHIPPTLLLFLCLSSMSVFTTMMAGWASNSKFSLLGSLRSIAQTISYEISMALILIAALMILMSLYTLPISSFFMVNIFFMLPILPLIWLATSLAETNRSPFDFAEGESELVSGFNTEYSGPEFAFIFMAEYLNIILMSFLMSVIFFQSTFIWFPAMIMKTVIISSLFIMARGTLPRLRYDRLMAITWTSFLPLSLSLPIIILPL